MAEMQGINIHHADHVSAEATKLQGGSWLTLKVGRKDPVKVTLFMDYDLAQTYVEAIRAANAEHERMLEEEAEFLAERARRNKEMSYEDEHRQRMHEVL
jgi:hypothetical protein